MSGVERALPAAPALARTRGSGFVLALTTLGVLVIAVLSLGIGSVPIPPATALRILASRLPFLNLHPDWPETSATILLTIRLPRVVLVALSGAALATSGAAYQAVFRNPLADPFFIGVSAGAGFGAIGAMAWRIGNPDVPGLLVVPLGAFACAMLTVAAVVFLSRAGGRTSTSSLILAGVAASALLNACSALLLIRLRYQLGVVSAFLLGSYGGAGWSAVQLVAPLVGSGCLVLLLAARPLNLLLFDEEQAAQLGVAVERTKLTVIVAATLITAAAVAFSGLIAFVGLLVPHAARLLAGPDHRRLLPTTCAAGAGFLMLADLLARTLLAPEELPLGIVTACVGAPFFLMLLRRANRAALL